MRKYKVQAPLFQALKQFPAEALLQELGRGVTAFSESGKYLEKEKKVLFCVFSKKEVHSVKSIIMNIDKKAFFVITDIREVWGKGFSDK